MNEGIPNHTANPEPTNIRKLREPTYRKIVKRLWILFGLGFLAVFGMFFFLAIGDLPTFEQLENPNSRLASEIYTADGEILGRYFTENRVNVNYSDLSPDLVNALISTEDERFYTHAGIDPEALGRVLFKTILLGKKTTGGGSTITQQLAKQLFDRPDFSQMNPIKKVWVLGTTKFREWLTAIKLERSYTKEEIITMYLNQFNFINGAYGIKSASEIYFSTSPDSLKIEESAMLVGMLQNPSKFNPLRFEEQAKERREIVFYQMKRNGFIDEEEYKEYIARDIDLTRFKRIDHNDGLAPYFREYLREDLKRILKANPKQNGEAYNVYKDGLRIYTTIDSRLQAHAEKASEKHLQKLQKKLFKHWEGKDPWTYKSYGSTTDADIERRAKSLKRLLQGTPRYKALREKYFLKAIELKLRDVDVDRMFIAEENPTKIDEWESSKFIGSKLGDKYRKILKSKDWQIIKSEKETLDKKTKEVFDRKTSMKVFAYNDMYQKDTVMSPLDSIRYHRMFMQTGVLAVEPQTGHVKAWVGGANHRWFKYDHVNKNTARQIGSTFKPFLYALSIDLRGYSPCFKVMDSPVTIAKGTFNLLDDWTPKNVGKFSNAEITLLDGLKMSKNSVSAYLMRDLGNTQELRNLVSKMGIDTTRVPPQPSICLGTPDISVFEMTGAYTTFANEGIATEPVYISRIEDKNGSIIYEPLPEQQQVLSEQANYVMVQMLKAVVGWSTGIKTEVGGKTGTTNFHADGWFMGITPNLVVGTWVGCDDRFVRFRTLNYGQGSYMAKPIFKYFMKSVEADKDIAFDINARFKSPSRDLEIQLDCEMYPAGGEVENDPNAVDPILKGDPERDPEGDPEGEEGDIYELGGF